MIAESGACGKRCPMRLSAIISLYMVQNEHSFIDEASISVKAGSGGNGIVHFRREKHVPLGGADGGDGGRGGSVLLVADGGHNTLLPFQRQRNFRAEHGRNGGGNNKTGRSGADLKIAVPPGTIVRAKLSGALLGDLTEDGQYLQVAKGGNGGKGNARFSTSRNRAPRVAEKGELGQTCGLALELRLIADVGIVGVPNAGKSTFLAAVSAARPKIADYSFTTLVPNLGVADLSDHRTLVLADIPGLIEGAHAGVGLGASFLRHVQRTRVLIHLLDGLSEHPLADFSQTQSELALFDLHLAAKPQVVALNKTDLPEVAARIPELQAQFSERGHELRAISAIAGQGVRRLVHQAAELLAVTPVAALPEEMPVYRPSSDPTDFEITRASDGSLRISGDRIERAAQMTYWEYDDAVLRFQRILEGLGVRSALQQEGVRVGDIVRIGSHELEWIE